MLKQDSSFNTLSSPHHPLPHHIPKIRWAKAKKDIDLPKSNMWGYR